MKQFTRNELINFAQALRKDFCEPKTDTERVFDYLKMRLMDPDHLKQAIRELSGEVPLTKELADEFSDFIYYCINCELNGAISDSKVDIAINLYCRMVPDLKKYF